MKKHILVVDDEIGALTLIGIMLERGGFGVLKAKDAKSALAILDQNTPDMIILDVMMPGMDGIEVCRQIRHNYEDQRPFILMYTADDRELTRRNSLMAGANELLTKDTPVHELASKIDAFLAVA